MDLTANFDRSPHYLHRRRVGVDGVVTIQYKIKPKRIRKVVVARGSNNITGGHSVGAVITSQLIPFRKSMLRQLAQRGFNTSHMDWNNIVALYYNEFVSNQYNKKSPFVPINSYEFCNNLAFKISSKDRLEGDLRDFRNAEGLGQVGNIVDNIINTYKFAKAKRLRAIQDGIKPEQVLSDIELRQALAADRVEKELTAKMRDNYSVKQGSIKKVLLWGIGIYLFYYLFLK
jgi:hypothetical protein